VICEPGMGVERGPVLALTGMGWKELSIAIVVVEGSCGEWAVVVVVVIKMLPKRDLIGRDYKDPIAMLVEGPDNDKAESAILRPRKTVPMA